MPDASNIPLKGYAPANHYANIKQCHLVKEDCLKISYTVYAGKSKVPSMKTARSRLDVTRNGA